MGSWAWIISPFCITPILHLQPSVFSLLLHCYGHCLNSAKKKICLYWRVSLFCCIYSKGEGERDRADLKLAENNSVWQKATKLQKQSNSTEVNQIWRGWDPNMLLTEPLALRTLCGQSDSPPHIPDTFHLLRETDRSFKQDIWIWSVICHCNDWASFPKWRPHQKWRARLRMGGPDTLRSK